MQARFGTRGNLYVVPSKAKEASDPVTQTAKPLKSGFLWMHVFRLICGLFNKVCIFPSSGHISNHS